MAPMTDRKPVESWLTDMDGVLVHEGQPVPGAPDFIGALRASGENRNAEDTQATWGAGELFGFLGLGCLSD